MCDLALQHRVDDDLYLHGNVNFWSEEDKYCLLSKTEDLCIFNDDGFVADWKHY